MSRWVTRALRRLTQAEVERAREARWRVSQQAGEAADAAAGAGPPLRDAHVFIAVAEDGKELVARAAPPR